MLMNRTGRIPVKTKEYVLTDSDTEINTEGLEAIIFADGGDVRLKAMKNADDADAFIIKDGTYASLGGRFWLSGSGASAYICFCDLF